MADADSSSMSTTADAARIIALESAIAERDARITELQRERDQLRAAYDRLWLEVELMRRRLFIAKAERIDTTQLELEFKDKLAELDKLAGTLGIGSPLTPSGDGTDDKSGSRPKPKGRRDLRQMAIPEERVEIADPEFEARVARGEAERIGFEESSKIAWQRGGPRRLIVARVKYRVPGDQPETTQLTTAPLPPQVFPRSLATVSLIARIIVDKYCDGLPLHRQEDRFARLGVTLDRGTMCRWMEHAGATAGATVIAAMRAEAMRTALCISTDATGVLVQPIRDSQRRQPCRRGHYFVQIADRDHVFFEYAPRETSAAVGEMFKGFSGYVQADAKSVYDILFRPPPEPPDDDAADLAACTEVGCLSHARRGLWEATIAKSAVAREGLARLGRVFALERQWKKCSPTERQALRDRHARPHLKAFFEWAEVEFARVKHERGLLRSALGYCVRHQAALMRYLDDGRLESTNNASERELRRIAVGRGAWLFVGSDDHAQAAGHLFSLVASARLHRLDPELYLRDLFRVLGHWPRDRYLELAPKYWSATRVRLDSIELAAELGPLSVPPPLAAPAEQE
jgi:transposase